MPYLVSWVNEVDTILVNSYQKTLREVWICTLLKDKAIHIRFSLRDWSKSMGGGGRGCGPEHLEIWLIKNTWLTPSLRHKND